MKTCDKCKKEKGVDGKTYALDEIFCECDYIQTTRCEHGYKACVGCPICTPKKCSACKGIGRIETIANVGYEGSTSPCSCTPDLPMDVTEDDWEDKFDKEFPTGFFFGNDDRDKIKSFVRDLLRVDTTPDTRGGWIHEFLQVACPAEIIGKDEDASVFCKLSGLSAWRDSLIKSTKEQTKAECIEKIEKAEGMNMGGIGDCDCRYVAIKAIKEDKGE